MSIGCQYLSPRRDSFCAGALAPSGQRGWSLDLGLEEGERPRFLLPWVEGRTLVETRRGVVLVGPPRRKPSRGGGGTLPGQVAWRRPKLADSWVAVREEVLYTLNPRRRLDGVRPDGELALEASYVPEVADEATPVVGLWPRERDYLAVVQNVGLPHGDGPLLMMVAADYGRRISTWEHEWRGAGRHVPLLLEEQARLLVPLLVPERRVHPLDIDTGAALPSFQLPLEPLEWSAGADGTVYQLGQDGEVPVLAAMAADGEERWRWQRPELAPAWRPHPPVVSDQHVVYVFAPGRVLALYRGGLEWWRDLPEGEPRAVALPDDLLLVAVGQSVVLLDRAGEVRFQLDLDEELLTAPLPTGGGRALVATASQLIEVR